MLRFAEDLSAEIETRHMVDHLADVVDIAQVPAQAVPIPGVQLALYYTQPLE